MTTYANQKVIKINKEKCTSDFLQIDNREWQAAARLLSSSAFILYLYLASNNDGFRIALSEKAVETATGLSKASYHRAFKELWSTGFLTLEGGNVYSFSTTPDEDGI